jgi:hypothetical protein
MTLTLMILVVAAPFAVWLFRRRAQSRSSDERPDAPPANNGAVPVAGETKPLHFETPHSAHSVQEIKSSYEPSTDASEESECEQRRAVEEVNHVQVQNEPEASHAEQAQLLVHGEAKDTELSRDIEVQADGQSLQPDEENSPVQSLDQKRFDDEKRTTEIEFSVIHGQQPFEMPALAVEDANSDGCRIERLIQDVENPHFTAQPTDDAQSELISEVEPDSSDQDVQDATESGVPEAKALRYRPPPQKLPRPAVKRVNQEQKSTAPSVAELEIRVRMTFDRFGFCALSLLPGRTPDLEEEITVKYGGSSLCLLAQEEWCQDLHFADMGDRLRDGVELKANLSNHRSARWLLKGRDLYVLAGHPRASGFVSAARLVLGRSDVVICTAELLPQVEAVLASAGCQGYSRIDESHGMPAGWFGLRGVSPTMALPLNSGIDPFYALKPAPDIDIELQGGVCLHHSVWLAGYPPQIKLFGQTSGTVKLLIDGKQAHQSALGIFTVDGHDLPGLHSVYCEGLSCSRSYSIEEPPDSWQQWQAYHFDDGDICGPLVHPMSEIAGRRSFTVPMSNPLLIGAEPGQIFRCSPRRVSNWKGFVPFDVVWALPSQPLICDKRTARIIQFGDIRPAASDARMKPDRCWSNAILDASRKGLRIDNSSANAAACWREYKKVAKSIWRSR